MSLKDCLQRFISIAIYPTAFFAGYYLAEYLTSTPFYEGYQIAKALRARRSKRSTKKLDLPASDSVGDATFHESSNSYDVRITNPIKLFGTATGFFGHLFTKDAEKEEESSQEESEIVGELQKINMSMGELQHINMSIKELSHVVELALKKD